MSSHDRYKTITSPSYFYNGNSCILVTKGYVFSIKCGFKGGVYAGILHIVYHILQSGAVITRSYINDIAHSTAVPEAGQTSKLQLKKYALMGKLRVVYSEDFGAKWPCYNGIVLYIDSSLPHWDRGARWCRTPRRCLSRSCHPCVAWSNHRDHSAGCGVYNRNTMYVGQVYIEDKHMPSGHMTQ